MQKVIRSLVISNYNKTPANKRGESEMLLGLVSKGIDVTIMTYRKNAYTELLETKGLKFIYHHPKRKISFNSISYIRKILREGKFDIIHLFNGRAVTNGLLAVRWLPVKVIAYYGSMKIYWHDLTAYLSYLNPRIDRIICISNAVKDQVRRQLPPWSRQKAVKIYKGYSSDWTEDVIPVERKEIDIPEDAFVICCVAGSRKIKGVPILIKAISKLPDNLPIYIMLLGWGIDHPRHLKLIEASKYKDNFRVLGRKEDVYNYISACDLYVQPSLSEGLGRAIIEAMLLRKPVVVSDNGGSKELVDNLNNGIVIKSGSVNNLSDSIHLLYKERDNLKAMGRAARNKIIDMCNIKDTINQTHNLYLELCKQK